MPAHHLGSARRTACLIGALLAALVTLTTISGCSNESKAGATPDEPKASYATKPSVIVGHKFSVQANPILTIKEAGHPNQGKDLVLSLDQLDAMGTIRYQVKDSDATGKTSEFSGPLLADVLKYAGVKGNTIKTLALNDYAIDIPMSKLKEFPVMLATHQDGQPMSVDNYGPTRVVFPNVQHKIGNEYDALWVWQLKDITVK